MQLERILQSQGFGTRRECRALVRLERVTVGGEMVDDPFVELDPEGLEFTVSGEAWRYHEKAYVMLHKPTGYECSQKPKHHPAVFALLPSPLVVRAVQCVGRLDEDTTGLLLLTDDGQFIHRLTSPKHGVLKRYVATTKHPVDDAQLAALRGGVELNDAPGVSVAAHAVEQLDANRLAITIGEGKYHQVKRMVAAAGNRCEALHRVAVGSLELPADLAPGEWRWINPSDV
ncbi:pseudouridine synthase [Methyloversatilis universalis]|uniref:pseudouridine synthase n=1 Tax=Methyloversatilis universalis TaxID=378211 RepID=UPI00036256C9|nr:16S rRNA pseudouridine(516) synthase [Methyloversatilis universalis]